MKKRFFIFTLLLILAGSLYTQDLIDLDYDLLDSLFDEPLRNEDAAEETEDTRSVLDNIRRRGIGVTLRYDFQGALVPGWDLAPWHFNGEEKFTWEPLGRMSFGADIDAQISSVFRVFTNFYFNLPGFQINLGDFYFDYNFFDRVFIRAGKYEQVWGISPNFEFINILSRVPDEHDGGQSYVLRADIPVGVGGFQLLTLTRADLLHEEYPRPDFIGYGAKYNLALRYADFDLGVFYQEAMATRGIFSIKTTLFDTEIYNEWLLVANTHTDNELSFAFNFGFGREFFRRRLQLNGEFFFNREYESYYFQPETIIREEDTIRFIESTNIAFNMLYRFGGRTNPRLFLRMVYAIEQDSMQLVPGFRISPVEHLEIYFATPMALGNRNGYYYINNTADPAYRPFSIMLYVTFSGRIQARYDY